MRFFVYYAMLFFPLVLFPLEERCITVFILRYRTVQHYGKERIKPYWEDVTSDSLSSIQCVFDKKSTRLKVSYDSVTMCATIKSDIFRLSDSVEIYLNRHNHSRWICAISPNDYVYQGQRKIQKS